VTAPGRGRSPATEIWPVRALMSIERLCWADTTSTFARDVAEWLGECADSTPASPVSKRRGRDSEGFLCFGHLIPKQDVVKVVVCDTSSRTC
jgi:hypothetical protein